MAKVWRAKLRSPGGPCQGFGGCGPGTQSRPLYAAGHPPSEVLDDADQLARLEGLGEMDLISLSDGLARVLGARVGGERDGGHRAPLIRGERADLAQEVVAVAAGHPDVADQK